MGGFVPTRPADLHRMSFLARPGCNERAPGNRTGTYRIDNDDDDDDDKLTSFRRIGEVGWNDYRAEKY